MPCPYIGNTLTQWVAGLASDEAVTTWVMMEVPNGGRISYIDNMKRCSNFPSVVGGTECLGGVYAPIMPDIVRSDSNDTLITITGRISDLIKRGT